MLIDIDTIIVTDRQRAEMTQSKLHELEFSIIRFGLLHPIVVAEAPDNKLQLVAGGRRLMTIAGLHNAGKVIYHNGRVITPGYIPATFINGDDLRLKEIELDENLIREDLSWQDRVRALSQIHALRRINNPS